jgi:transmembrane sensor
MTDDLIERALSGGATPEEIEALLIWRRASQEHERRYAQVARLIEAARELRGELRAAIPPSAAELLHRARAGVAADRTNRRWVPWSVAAAALIIAAGFGWRLVQQRSGAPQGAEIVTGVSEMTTVQLPDGSVIRLAPASRLVIGGRGSHRDVTLQGRAFFAIASARGQPFRVRTRLGEARVLGTRFELAAHDDDLELVVVEGRVALAAPANTVEVLGGQSSRVAHGTAAPPIAVTNPDSVLRWIGKFVVFQSTALRDAAREVERTYGIHVAITDSLLGAQTVTATFTDQSPARVMEVLCSVVNARCKTMGRGDTVTVSSP